MTAREQSCLERDFRRFRATGDPQALARVFDAAAPGLLVLAQHLVRDAGRAEDLVQGVFVAAIEDARRWDGTRALMPWLSSILAHRALDQRRRERVRGVSAKVPETFPSGDLEPSELAAGRELARRAAREIEAMPEAERRVLVLRLVHGLSPAEIAHALGESPGAVRMRLKRGRDRLRGVLPAAGAALALFLGERARGLGSVRRAVVERATEIAAGSATAGSGATLAGVLTMKTTAFVAGSVALLAAVWWARPGQDPEDQAPQSALLRAQPGPPSARDLPGEAPAHAPATRVAAIGHAPPQASAIAVRVVRASDGEPAADVGVYVRPEQGFGLEGRTDSAGAVSFEGLTPGLWTLDLDRWSSPAATVPLAADSRKTIDVVLPAGIEVQGRVVDLLGRPVAEARIYRVNALHEDLLQLAAAADLDGRFHLADVAPETRLVARREGFQPSRPTWVGGRTPCRLVLEMGARGQRVAGVVLDSGGRPVPWAQVAFAVDEDAREQEDGVPLAEPDPERAKAPDLEAFFTRADSEGRFESREVPAGTVRVIARPPERDAAGVGWLLVDLLPGAEQEVTLRLGPGASVVGRLTDEHGAPLAGLEVEAEWEGGPALGQTEDEMGPWIADRHATSAADGRYSLVGLLPGEYDLRVLLAAPNARESIEPEGRELVRDEVELAPGEARTWSPILPRLERLELVVLDPGGDPLAGWGLGWSARPGELDPENLQPRATDAEGHAELPVVGPGPFEVSVHAPDGAGGVRFLPAAIRSGVRARRGPVVIRLHPGEVGKGCLTARIVDTGGEPLRSGITLERTDWRLAGGSGSRAGTGGGSGGEDGLFRFGPLAQSSYRLLAQPAGVSEPVVLGEWTLSAGQELDLGTLVVPSTAGLEVRLRDEAGRAVEGALVGVSKAGSASVIYGWADADGVARFTLWPGEYSVRVEGSEIDAAGPSVTLTGGSTLRRMLVCRAREE